MEETSACVRVRSALVLGLWIDRCRLIDTGLDTCTWTDAQPCRSDTYPRPRMRRRQCRQRIMPKRVKSGLAALHSSTRSSTFTRCTLLVLRPRCIGFPAYRPLCSAGGVFPGTATLNGGSPFGKSTNFSKPMSDYSKVVIDE